MDQTFTASPNLAVRRFFTVLWWLIVGFNSYFWLVIVGQIDSSSRAYYLDITVVLFALLPLGLLPGIRWISTGRWHFTW